jgi:cytochrome c1
MVRIQAGGANALRLSLVILMAGCASGSAAESSSGPAAATDPPAAPATAASPATSPAAPATTLQPPADASEPEAHVGGIFTEAQADRGRTTFDEVCSECHTTSEFRGRTFQSNWGRRTVYSLFRTVRSTMPDDNPGGLEEQVYLDVVSYILSMNGHGPGTSELSPDSPMREVRIAPGSPGR